MGTRIKDLPARAKAQVIDTIKRNKTKKTKNSVNSLQTRCLPFERIVFTLDFLTAGLNGPNGLMRQNFIKGAIVKDKIRSIILSQKQMGFIAIDVAVKITYIRYCSLYMDWDNACASFKYIGDALQDAGIIISDDSQYILVEFIPKQIKCKRVDERTEIIIEPLKPFV